MDMKGGPCREVGSPAGPDKISCPCACLAQNWMKTMKEVRYSDPNTIKCLPVSVNAKKEDLREIFGILLSLLVIAAFLIIAFSMFMPRAKDVGALLTSMSDSACAVKTL